MSEFLPRTDIVPWGRIPSTQMRVARPFFADELDALIKIGAAMPGRVLAGGLRRSYGGSCVNDGGGLIDMTGLDRFIQLDRQTGHLVAEAGVSLAEILEVAIPAGFFLPVTPGTKFVTLGGAIANDVHGKNHHGAGTIGCWIRRIDLLRSDGVEHSLRPDDSSGLFSATIGGLGLTGIMARVELELMPITSSDMQIETIPFQNLAEFFALADESEATHPYTVAWVDCLGKGRKLGRGIFTRARHRQDGELRVHSSRGPSMPIDAPGFLLNRLSLSAFNECYYRIAGRARQTTVSYDPFFYPLDVVGDWNRLYGRRGFYQYQSVVPPDHAADATAQMLRTIAQAGEGSFLAVLKTFGALSSPGLLSFPKRGATLALDFVNRGAKTLSLLDKLDAIVREAGGRLYPAKDGRLPPAMFVAGYPELNRFRSLMDPGMSSTFWRRMSL